MLNYCSMPPPAGRDGSLFLKMMARGRRGGREDRAEFGGKIVKWLSKFQQSLLYSSEF